MNRYLILDCTLKGAVCALAMDRPSGEGAIVTMDYFPETNQVATVLADFVGSLLKRSGWCQGDLTHILVSVGPGSFTGIKIGLAFAYGWVTGSQDRLQIVGISSLEALARNAQKDLVSHWFLPLTRTDGFLAEETDGKVDITYFDWTTGLSKIDAMKSDRKRVGLVLPWDTVVDGLTTMGIEHFILEEPALMVGVVQGMLTSYQSGYYERPQTEGGALLPRYIRRSAPEERMAIQKELS